MTDQPITPTGDQPVSPTGSSSAPAPDPTNVRPFGGPVRDQADVDSDRRQADAETARAAGDEQLTDAEQADLVAQQKAEADAAAAAAAGAPADPVAVAGPDGVHRLTVGDGESLDYIADREDVNAEALYTANAPVIEAAAQARGFGTSDRGRLLFPGTTLDLPSR